MADYVYCTECGLKSLEADTTDTVVIDRTEDGEPTEVQFTCPGCSKFAQSIRVTEE